MYGGRKSLSFAVGKWAGGCYLVSLISHDILALAKNIPAKRPEKWGNKHPYIYIYVCSVLFCCMKKTSELVVPNRMLNKFGTLNGTLNTKIPAMEMGILFNDPTKLPKFEGRQDRATYQHSTVN